MAEDVIFREPQLVHHGDKAVIDPFFAIIVRIASCAVIFVKGAYPLHSTRHTPSPIERAALRTLNAACKRIDILGSCSGESLLAFLDKLLNSIEHILVNDTGMCSFGIEAIFLSAVDMLVEWDRCFTVSFLIETIADIPFIFQHIGYSVRMPALLAGLGRNIATLQFSANLTDGETPQIQVENVPHNSSFRLVHSQCLVDQPVSVRGVAVHILAKFHALDD